MKPILKLESTGAFRNSTLTVISTGEELPVSEIDVDFDIHGMWTRIRLAPGTVAIDVDPAKEDREKAEYDRLSKRYGSRP